MLASGLFVSLSNIRISTWFDDASSGAAERKSCTTVSRKTCGSTGRTQGIPSGGVNGRRAMPGFRLEGAEGEDTKGARIGARVSCGILGGEWESARM